uniref:Uncharacterized protein n=1 Tax=Hyaloperonospora arabidopsidis (strain Emoy2) TaxID=559515 RepID=M4B349_HYAAE
MATRPARRDQVMPFLCDKLSFQDHTESLSEQVRLAEINCDPSTCYLLNSTVVMILGGK